MRVLRLIVVSLSVVLSAVAVAADIPDKEALKSEPQNPVLEKNNSWNVRISNSVNLQSPLWITIRKFESHWEIEGIYGSPVKIPVSRKIELFLASRDLQQWTNYFKDMRGDCDTFEVRESDFHSVCTSSLAGKKAGLGFAGLFLGGKGGIPYAYTDSEVQAAINSIRPDQAAAMLDKFEKKFLDSEAKATTQQVVKMNEQRKYLENIATTRRDAPIGAKDWCEQTVKQSGIFTQVDPTYTCQVYGVVDDDILRKEGWAITNKQTRNIGTAPQKIIVTDISIEKVLR